MRQGESYKYIRYQILVMSIHPWDRHDPDGSQGVVVLQCLCRPHIDDPAFLLLPSAGKQGLSHQHLSLS